MIELQITTAHNHCDAFSVPVRRVASGAAPRFLAAGAVGAVSEPRAAAAAGGGLSTVAGAAELSFCAAFHARCALFHVVGSPHADHASSNGIPRAAIFQRLEQVRIRRPAHGGAARRGPATAASKARTRVSKARSAKSRSCGVLHMQRRRYQGLAAMAAGARAAARAIASVGSVHSQAGSAALRYSAQ